jgi:hypothetical protein
MTQLAQIEPALISNLVIKGDLSGLTPEQKVEYYKLFCERLGLDALTQPFKLLRLNGKEILYCDRSGAQQLNKKHNVSHEVKSRETSGDLYIVTCRASLSDGRFTESIGAVNIKGLSGDNLANALMKGETKAKRRATLDLLGLGILDETEAETIKDAVVIPDEVFRSADELKDDYLKLLTELEQVTKRNPPYTDRLLPDNWQREQTQENFLKAIDHVKKLIQQERDLRHVPHTVEEVNAMITRAADLDDYKEERRNNKK